MAYEQVAVGNETGKKIKIYWNGVEQYDLAPYAGDWRITPSLPFLDSLKFYFDDNPNPCAFSVNTSEQTFSWEGLPSDVVLILQHLKDVPSYGDLSKLPPQSGNFPFALDQFGNSWCILSFDDPSNWAR
jgi:hypothetical protein